MRKLAAGFAAAAIITGAGCATLGRATFAEPVVHLQDVQLKGLGMTGGSMDVILSVYNPNRFRLDATQMTYRIMVDTVGFANGIVQSRFNVQANDSTLVTIPVSFTYAGIGEAGRQILGTGTVNYRVLGDVTVGTPLGNFTVPYDRTGRFSTLGGRSE